MKFPNFRGVIPALTTPFRQDLSLDADGASANGVHIILE